MYSGMNVVFYDKKSYQERKSTNGKEEEKKMDACTTA